LWGTSFASPSSSCIIKGFPAHDVDIGEVIGWRSQHDFVFNRNIFDFMPRETKPVATFLPFLEYSGIPLGYGMYPNKDPFVTAVAAIGRQQCAVSVDQSYRQDYEIISKLYVKKILDVLDMSVDWNSLIDSDNEAGFHAALKNIPERRRKAIYSNAVAYLMGSGYKADEAGCFVKVEDSHKGPGQLQKPRNIMTMSDKDYYFAWPALIIMHIIYKCPLVEQWMIKNLTATELFEKIMAVCSVPHASQDMSGFENGLEEWMRAPENDLLDACLRRAGADWSADHISKMVHTERKISNPNFRFSVAVRCSGDFWTSLGNGLTNICIILTGHYVKMGRPPLEQWWASAQSLRFLTEGDDAIVPLDILNREVTLGLNVKFSAYNDTQINGGSDFLKTTSHPVFIRGRYAGKLGNTLRWCRSLTWVNAVGMKDSKTKFLWRAKALALLHLAPHHPIINPLCQAIGRLTAGLTEFRGWEKMSRKWGFDYNSLPAPSSRFPPFEVAEPMRAVLASSQCPELPPIAIEEQLIFERQCEVWDGKRPLITPHSWTEYPEWESTLIPVSSSPEPNVGTFGCPNAKVLFEIATGQYPQMVGKRNKERKCVRYRSA